MSLLMVTKLSKYFGSEPVFVDATFQISAGQRMAVVGVNGSGKSTLLRVIMGRMSADSGSVVIARRARVGYVVQDTELKISGTPWEAMLACRHDIHAIRAQLRKIENQMADPQNWHKSDRMTQLMSQYSHWQQRYEAAGGYHIETTAKMILTGLGLTAKQWDSCVHSLSGGERMRLALALALMQDPDLLILDEPTNHLDIDAAQWLEEYLVRFEGAILLVSHDRYFLDKVATDILELEDCKLTHYRGNYSKYVQQKRHNYQTALKEYQKSYRKAEHLRGLIQRFGVNANRAAQAKSWAKKLQRLDLNKPQLKQTKVKLAFDDHISGAREVLTVSDLGFGYDDEILFSDFSCKVYRGEKIVILGPNGCGKSTLLKILLEQLEPWSGEVVWGKGIRIGYFDQTLSVLNEDLSVLEQVQQWSKMSEGEARSFLARYLFQGDDVFKRVGVLSGGERNRLIMSQLFLSNADVLVLDEPTNHLDLPAREALEEALKQYRGTIIFVTHDRYFIKQIATRFWLFHDGTIVDFPGDYQELMEFLKEREIA